LPLNIPNGNCQCVLFQGLNLGSKAYFAAAAQFFKLLENFKRTDIGQGWGPVLFYFYGIEKIVPMNKQIDLVFFFVPEEVQFWPYIPKKSLSPKPAKVNTKSVNLQYHCGFTP
jgi:hypothetical protein